MYILCIHLNVMYKEPITDVCVCMCVLLVSYICMQFVLNPQPHPPPPLFAFTKRRRSFELEIIDDPITNTY